MTAGRAERLSWPDAGLGSEDARRRRAAWAAAWQSGGCQGWALAVAEAFPCDLVLIATTECASRGSQRAVAPKPWRRHA